MGPEIAAFILFFIILIILVKGHFSLAGNLLLICCQSAIWGVMFLSDTDLLTRTDTIILIAATLSMMPIIVVTAKILFAVYSMINIAVLFLFAFYFQSSMNISEVSIRDFLSDSTVAFIFIGIISYTAYSINSKALERAENEIAERKKAEKQRNRLQMQLLQSQKLESVGLLAGGVAHDFNNMLAAVQGFAELAADEPDLKNTVKSEIDEIIKASKKARDLTRQLLAFARIQPLDMKVINLNQIISDFTGMLSRTIRGNITIQNNLCDNPGVIEGDPIQIEQVILNLVLNAQDSMPRGGTITIETSRTVVEEDFVKKYENISAGEYIILSVSDSGSGIEPGIIDKIFDPFFTTKEFGKGTGLGLSTAYGIVKQHCGMIHVYSEKNKGTIFRIYLPLKNRMPEDNTPLPIIPDIPNGTETILAVEDNPEVSTLLKTILNRNGYTSFIAGDAETALSISASYEGVINLLITDVIIPDMNGMQLYKKISETRPEIKSIFISGYTSNVIAHNGRLDEGINFIQKPFSISDFSKKVRDVLDS
ncbi:MAG: hybrid sensor histidine kinase/response regulator [Spirochaetae bacterium HGW-Spirochaetae-5]|nr:MAG: hybrid sensor histidine kinase/response regulator [Spirochaetae bacterium HGW-Spirochaetae-5]